MARGASVGKRVGVKWFVLGGWPALIGLSALAGVTERPCFGLGYQACEMALPWALALAVVSLLAFLVYAIHRQRHRR